MLTLDLILRIVAALSELAVEGVKKATPDQVQRILDRHDKRMDFYDGLIAKFRGQAEAPEPHAK